MGINPRLDIAASDMGGAVRDLYTTANAITAFATGGQASAVLLGAAMNRVTVVATTGDSVKLPLSKVGAELEVYNRGANSLNVFPAVGEQISTLGANTAYPLATVKSAKFSCMVAGNWDVILSA